MKELIECILENRGHDFEKEYVQNFEPKYREELEDFLELERDSLKGGTVELLGGENSGRPLQINGSSLLVGSKKHSKTVGDDVVDVLYTNGEISYNLSLKAGNKISYFNFGISRLFPKQKFNEFLQTEEFNISDDALALLKFFHIDPIKFANVFVSYKERKRKSTKDEIDITPELKNSKEFINFMESAIGYNYILVHKIKNKVYYTDLRTYEDMKKFIGNVEKATIFYSNDAGSKTVRVEVEFTNMILGFDFRDKQGGIFPTSIVGDYKSK